ncbi:hypothetical protein [Nitrososphaera viennensis]|uniref:Uncharacterized protein n=2 Tax=Nitrososphaera viennensis TaxID=1034015 RepID=A0A060HD33_9ARCH|nr:hypothetical protein [Nitrososphaera viennensis]AIC14649.1 hypothetical protein NVIE_004550 [Nitrososphaera viennensis EN76]UVS69614.1 hypothetical protein NWT39_02225 [Nitrososphaera viennensis]
MNKPIVVALSVLAVFFSATAVSVMPVAHAQYGVGGSPVAGATQEQLQECETLGINRSECTENAILAKRRITAVQDNLNNPDKGSGTNYFSGNETWVYIGVLGAIFGGVAAAFFFRGRGATPPS